MKIQMNLKFVNKLIFQLIVLNQQMILLKMELLIQYEEKNGILIF